MVLGDIVNEKVSVKRAREVYGVVIREGTMDVDTEETRKLRERMRKQDAGGR